MAPAFPLSKKKSSAPAAVAVTLLAACGGSTAASAPDSGSNADGAAALDARTEAPPADDCASAFAGGSCSTEGQTCYDRCPDPCMDCGFLGCSAGVWSAGTNFPPPSCFEDAGSGEASTTSTEAGTKVDAGGKGAGALCTQNSECAAGLGCCACPFPTDAPCPATCEPVDSMGLCPG
jgi:hypothetical protein